MARLRKAAAMGLLAVALMVASVQAANVPIVVVNAPEGERGGAVDAVGGLLVFSACNDGGCRLYAMTPGSSDAPEVVFDGVSQPLATVAGHLYFRDDAYQLWRTDGTPQRTTQLSQGAARYGRPVVCRGETFYTTTLDGSGWTLSRVTASGHGELLLSTGDDGIVYDVGCVRERLMLVKATTDDHAFPPALLELVGAVVFDGVGSAAFGTDAAYVVHAATESQVARVLRTDGTVAGTTTIDLPSELVPFHVEVVGDGALFTMWGSGSDAELWATDGTPEDARHIGSWRRSPLRRLVPPEFWVAARTSRAIFYLSGTEIWASDGTIAGTQRVLEVIYRASTVAPGERVVSVETAGETVYFLLKEWPPFLPHTRLVSSDGTTAGSIEIARWSPDAPGGGLSPPVPEPSDIAFADDRLYVIGPPSPPSSPPSCDDSLEPLACELDRLAETLTCDQGATAGLTRTQRRRLTAIADRLERTAGVKAGKASRRAMRLLQHLQRRFVARRTITRVGADCASALAMTLQATRDRIAARGR